MPPESESLNLPRRNPDWPPGFLRPCPLQEWIVLYGPVVGCKTSRERPACMTLIGKDGSARAAAWSVIGWRRGSSARSLQEGDLVLATKYADGDPGDHYAVGFLAGVWRSGIGPEVRYDILDQGGSLFRYNGFRRCARISPRRARWLIDHFPEFESAWQFHRRSVWWWWRAPMGDIDAVA